MHLWPSMKLRDSFKKEYLKKIEWNSLKMKMDKQIRDHEGENGVSIHQNLLNDGNSQEENGGGSVAGICRDLFLIFSCCYCCFCCGACVDEEGN
ncbi:hypothetical protein LIER_10980 [Lithospermum erythrorhizon]|uniref:Uncharacterized protein n=1 Tax=Lithospermum erythrorhizon TaxID=34254 RepID=A0AAV3PND3_LITER